MTGQLLPSFLTRKGRKNGSNKKNSVVAATRSYPRQKICDVRSGPPPPRGSLSNDKLAYLDWRLSHIRDARIFSERTDYSWVDGRNTIGRTSFDIVEVIRDSDNESSSSAGSSQRQSVAVYETEKVTGTQALKQALLMDNAITSMPLLTRDAGSDSEDSSDQQHAGKDQVSELRPTSMFHRASFQLKNKDQSQTTGYFTKSKSIEEASEKTLRSRVRPLSRFWQL